LVTNAMPGSDPILTREEVAKWLQLKPRQVERLGIPYLRLGQRTVRYRKADVEAWLASCRRAAA
jgi:excisionase family DNA binding protein